MPQIMVVDDSRTQRTIISQFLKPLDCEIVLYETGEDALLAISEHVPDLIILDVEMPGLSGFDSCKAIRGFLQETWVPIIYLTARTDPKDIVEGLTVGGDTYLTKPVHEDVLLAITKAMLRLSHAQAELLNANKQLEEMAHYDVLTQIMNRRGYENIYERLWKDHFRRKGDLCVLLMDIDYFKKYNDHYGHIEGDKCLRQVAQTLKSEIKRPVDIIARYGGEEFIVVLAGTDLNGAQIVAQRLIDAMAKANIPHELSDTAKHVSLSIGIAQAGAEKDASELVQLADQALYQAKENGRNRFSCYDGASTTQALAE